jgi:hypothetical protein
MAEPQNNERVRESMQIHVRRLITILISVFALYLLAGNVFLNSPLGPWAINRKPEKFTLDWSYGLTWWPGQVALWNVQAKGHVRRILWSADAANAHGQIALLPLFDRELRIPSLVVGAVSATINRVEDDMLPPDYRAGGWILRFDRIATDSLHRVSGFGGSLETEGSASFAFSKQLRGGPMEIFPSHFNLRDTRIAVGEHEVLRGAAIDGDFAMARHRSADVTGMARIALIDAALSIQGASPGLTVELDPAGHWRGAIAAITDGKLDIELALREGTLQSGGVVKLRVPMSSTRGSIASNEAANLELNVGASDIRLHAVLPPPPEGRGSATLDLGIAGTSLAAYADPAAMLSKVSGSVSLDWDFSSLEWLGPLLVKTPWLSMHGAGTLAADIKLLNGEMQPGSRIDIPEVEIKADVAQHRFSGRARAQGRLEANGKTQTALVSLHVAEFSAAASDAPKKSQLNGRNMQLELSSQGDLKSFRDSLHAALRFQKAQIPDLRAINTYLPGSSFAVHSGGATVDGDLALDSKGRVQKGRIGLTGRRISAKFGEIAFSGDFDLDARVGGSNLAKRYFDLDNTSLRLSNIAVTDAGRTAGERWWANIKLLRGRLEATRPLTIDAKTDIELENIGLLLALFTRHADYPRWVLKLADAGNVRASGRFAMRDKHLTFDRIEAKNDRFEVKARMQIANAQPRGDLLLRWRALGLGLEMKEARKEFHWRRATEWYHARSDLLPN